MVKGINKVEYLSNEYNLIFKVICNKIILMIKVINICIIFKD